MVGFVGRKIGGSTFGEIHGFQAWEALGWFSLFCWIGLVGFVGRIYDDDDDDDDDVDGEDEDVDDDDDDFLLMMMLMMMMLI